MKIKKLPTKKDQFVIVFDNGSQSLPFASEKEAREKMAEIEAAANAAANN